jgi:hypothetical protein
MMDRNKFRVRVRREGNQMSLNGLIREQICD